MAIFASYVWAMPTRARRYAEGASVSTGVDSGAPVAEDTGPALDANADASVDASADAAADAGFADAAADAGLSTARSTRFPDTSAKYLANGTAGNITTCDTVCTVSFWISPDSTDYNNTYLSHNTASSGGTCDNSKWYIHGKDTLPVGTNTYVYVNVGAVPGEGQTTTQLTVGAWNHVVFVYDGTQTGNAARLKIYFNGAAQTLAFNGTIPANLGAGGTECQFGIPALANTPRAPSYIDEVAFWARALTAGEVATLYNSGNPTDLTGSSNLIAWWRMGDNVSGTTIIDEVSGNNLSVNGGSPTFSTNVPHNP